MDAESHNTVLICVSITSCARDRPSLLLGQGAAVMVKSDGLSDHQLRHTFKREALAL